MQVDQKKSTPSKFPLRLMRSVRRAAEEFSQKEGVSLNQFINVAVSEKLAHLQHDQWLARRPKPTPSVIAKGLRALDRQTGNPPAVGDELPDGYISIRAARKAGPLRGKGNPRRA
jgi:hypothetical protein